MDSLELVGVFLRWDVGFYGGEKLLNQLRICACFVFCCVLCFVRSGSTVFTVRSLLFAFVRIYFSTRLLSKLNILCY